MQGRRFSQFPLVERFMGLRMEVDFSSLRPGRTRVVESVRRLARELSYGFIHALWWVRLEDGRTAASVPPGAGKAVSRMLRGVRSDEGIFDPELAGKLSQPVNESLAAARLPAADRALHHLCFASSGALLRRHSLAECTRLVDQSLPAARDLTLPAHCLGDGIAFAVVADGTVVSFAFAHRTGVMEDKVADIGVETAPGYRSRGYARAAVSAVAAHVIDRGGEATYSCDPHNAASIATAASAGFAPWGKSLILAARAPA